MKVVFVASEAAPFAKTGGLADVAGSLPKALNSPTVDVEVFLPLHAKINKTFRSEMTFIGETEVKLGWRHKYVGIFKMK